MTPLGWFDWAFAGVAVVALLVDGLLERRKRRAFARRGTLTLTLTADVSRFQAEADRAAVSFAAFEAMVEWRRFLAQQRAIGRRTVERQADAARARLGLPSGRLERELAEQFRQQRAHQALRMYVLAGFSVQRPGRAVIVTSVS